MSTKPPAMKGAVLSGNSTVEFRDFPTPPPGHGQVLVQMKASSICASQVQYHKVAFLVKAFPTFTSQNCVQSLRYQTSPG